MILVVLFFQFLIPLLIAALGTTAVVAITSASSSSSIPANTDCSDEFIAFDKANSLTASKREQLISARRVLEEKIRAYFKSKKNTTTPTFYIQGSYKHKTLIRKQDDTCDIDLGIYFNGKPAITPLSIHDNVIAALGNRTKVTPIRKNKCVRLPYANQFHIDIPVYYYDGEKFFLGIGDSGWRQCDPRMFTKWISEETKGNSQKLRLIKYFKSWVNVVSKAKSQKMPSGLALTIWVLENYVEDNREDVAFVKTAEKLKSNLAKISLESWSCTMPVIPNDNVIEKLDSKQRENFLSALDELLKVGNGALRMKSKEESLKIWTIVFGRWFPQ